MRVAEARRAESLAEQGGVKLLGSLDCGKPSVVTEADFDRLEAAAFELERRVLTAGNVSKRCGEPAELAGEIERLRRQVDSWRAYIEANRGADPATQLRQLEVLVRGQIHP